MDQSSPISDAPVRVPSRYGRPQLTLVDARLRLAHPGEDMPEDWRGALEALLGWLGVAAEIVPADGVEGPVFAPWLGWSPTAFQHGGLADLPQAQFVVSYLLDHPRSAAPGMVGLDLMLMSPHPAQCLVEEAEGVPVPGADVLAAMIRASRAQTRSRAAIIVSARQRNAVATRLAAAGEGTACDILTLEEALPPLMAARAPWDAVIAMPEIRSTVFTLLGQAGGLSCAWPMLWFGGTSGQTLRLVTSEVPGDGRSCLPLDAPALIHALALALHAAGAERQAVRLHEAWALLRDGGVITAGHGKSDAPYCSEVTDTAFVAMLCKDGAVSKRPQQPWLALQNDKNASAGSQTARLRVIS